MGHLRIRGTRGYLDGETAVVSPGEAWVIGRSRACDLSLRKSRRWVDSGRPESEAEQEFKAVSRRHVRIRVVDDGQAEIEGLGRNGTYVDGVRIDRVLLTDLRERAHELRLGPEETATLEWVDGAEAC